MAVGMIQECSDSASVRHPLRPSCGTCRPMNWGSMKPEGKGAVYGLTVSHHPEFPGRERPLLCGSTELEEATCIVSNVVGCSPAEVRTGMPVEVSIENLDDGLKLLPLRPAK